MRILVAEDEKDLNRLLSTRLKQSITVWTPVLTDRRR